MEISSAQGESVRQHLTRWSQRYLAFIGRLWRDYRRLLLLPYLLALLIAENWLRGGVRPAFNAALVLYGLYLAFCHIWSGRDPRYDQFRRRILRLQGHLLFSAALHALSGARLEVYILYLVQAANAAVFFSPTWAIAVGAEAAVLAGGCVVRFGRYSPELRWPWLATAVLATLGASALAISAWQWYQADKRERENRASAVRRVGAEVLHSITLGEAVDATLSRIQELIPYRTALLFQWDPQKQLLMPCAQRGYDPTFLTSRGFTFSLGEGLTGYVLETGHPLLVRDVLAESPVPPRYPDIAPGVPLRSFLGVPLLCQGKRIGVLELTSDEVGAFNEEHKEILGSLADQISIALRNARLQDQLREQLSETHALKQDLERRLRELEALYNISLSMADKGLNIRELMQTIVDRAAELLGAHGACILLSYPEKQEVRVCVTHNLDGMLDWKFKFGEEMGGHVAQTGKSLRVDDYQTLRDRSPKLTQEPYSGLIRAVVQVPMTWQGEVIGVLAVSHNVPDKKFSEDDERLLQRLASAAALAIGNARLAEMQRVLVRSSPDAIIAVDRAGRIIEYNDASRQMLGWERDEVASMRVENLYDGGLAEARRINQALIEAGGKGFTTNSAVVSKSGERIPIKLSASALFDEFGERLGSVGIMTDLRNLTRLEKKAEYSEFLARVERAPQSALIRNLADLRQEVAKLLHMTCEFCRAQYVILFASVKEGETVLPALASAGVPPEVQQRLPHFNWRKAGLPVGGGEAAAVEEIQRLALGLDMKRRQELAGGIRGDNAAFFSEATLLLPHLLTDSYRSMLVFGPCAEPLELEFVRSVNLTIANYALGWLQTLYLRQRHEEAQLSSKLIIHRARMDLLRLNGLFGHIKRITPGGSEVHEKAKQGEELVDLMARSIHRALTSRVIEMELEDYHPEPYSLATLVQNCAATFYNTAAQKRVELRVDESLERLPYMYLDPTLLGVALGNLIDNAIKYAFPGTWVRVRAEVNSETVRILVDDLGEEMVEQARENLLKPGERWGVSARARRTKGMGFGLWEASVIARVHEGWVDFSCRPHPELRKGAYHVCVWIELPLLPKGAGVSGSNTRKEDNVKAA